MCVSVNNDFVALQYGQENRLVFVFSLWYSARRSLALEVFKSPILQPILLLLLLLQLTYLFVYQTLYFGSLLEQRVYFIKSPHNG